MAKKGRPKIEPPSPDEWAVVRQARRLQLVNGGAPERSEYPLGILLERNIISQDQHNAGLKFAWLYAKAHGRTRDCGLDYGYNAMDESRLADVEAEYVALRKRLTDLSRATFDDVVNVAVYRRLPWWATQRGVADPHAGKAKERLVKGLEALAKDAKQ